MPQKASTSFEEPDGDVSFTAMTLGHIAGSQEMPKVDRDAGLSKESLQGAIRRWKSVAPLRVV